MLDLIIDEDLQSVAKQISQYIHQICENNAVSLAQAVPYQQLLWGMNTKQGMKLSCCFGCALTVYRANIDSCSMSSRMAKLTMESKHERRGMHWNYMLVLFQ